MHPYDSTPRLSPSPRQAGLRGFSLIELVVVVVVIGIFAALAVPNVTRQLRDRRVQETAERVMHLYRGAKLRALGRGGAVLVRYTGTGSGTLEVREGRIGVATDEDCAAMPNPSCVDVNWNAATADPDATNQALTVDRLVAGDTVAGIEVEMDYDSASSVGVLDVCYTPGGRTFVRTVANGNWTPLASVPVARVSRTAGGTVVGLTRTVLILPSGSARLGQTSGGS